MGLHQKERSRVAYVWMTSSGDGHRVRGVQVQDEKPEVICFEACDPHCDYVHVNMCLGEGFPHCNMRNQFKHLHQVVVDKKGIPT